VASKGNTTGVTELSVDDQNELTTSTWTPSTKKLFEDPSLGTYATMSGVTDVSGNLLDGQDTGHSASNFVTIVGAASLVR
jgi:hypothetical protein